MLTTGKDIREHYIRHHSFEDLKLWGFNKELLKQELGMQESRYQEDFVKIFDVNDTFRGIEFNEREYAKQIHDEVGRKSSDDELRTVSNFSIMPVPKSVHEEQMLNSESFEKMLIGDTFDNFDVENPKKPKNVTEIISDSGDEKRAKRNSLFSGPEQPNLTASVLKMHGEKPLNRDELLKLVEPPAFVPERMTRFDGNNESEKQIQPPSFALPEFQHQEQLNRESSHESI